MDTGYSYEVRGYNEAIETIFTPGGSPRRVKRVRFMIGDNGPYSLTFEYNEDNPDNIARQIGNMVAQLRATHGKLNQGM